VGIVDCTLPPAIQQEKTKGAITTGTVAPLFKPAPCTLCTSQPGRCTILILNWSNLTSLKLWKRKAGEPPALHIASD
jgi:hypothetical protein